MIPQFGSVAQDADLVLRPGGYAVIVDAEGRIAVLDVPAGRMLPGGGQDAGESPEDAALREAAEECGVADELVHARAEGRHFRKRCTFFRAHVVGTARRVDTDHVLAWVAPGDAIATLAHASQAWAVRRLLEAMTQ